MEFLDFLGKLSNPEKSRNFNRFNNYTLEPFAHCLERFRLHQPPEGRTRISVVGTNGKGSLVHYLAKLLEATSSVGVYTSPHLVSPLERIQLNSQPISVSQINALFDQFSPIDREYLENFSYFEVFTLFAILYFSAVKPDWEIYEAGLGGRLDATRLTNPDIVVMTKIGLDHTAILGETEEKILLEKIQIVGTKTRTVYALRPENPHLHSLLLDIAKDSPWECKIFDPKRSKGTETDRQIPNKMSEFYTETYYRFARWILDCEVQKKNIPIPTAYGNYEDFPKPPGRLERLLTNPHLFYDTAHNPEACANTITQLGERWTEQKWICVVGSLPDKDGEGIYSQLTQNPRVEKVYCLDFLPFAPIPDGYPEIVPIHSEAELATKILDLRNQGKPILVMGSFRIYSFLKAFSEKLSTQDPGLL